ncbi:MAG TPA: pyridoxal-dependent decarboxylase [Thermoanaerobaculia bacterium]|nr:pyridoxal-dependent decarboxylase [Thermoanaerobaculia bacterium]
MTTEPRIAEHEVTLDPDDWDAFAQLGHRIVDDVIAYVREARERPVWRRMPDDIRKSFRVSAPIEPTDASEVYDEFVRSILPFAQGNNHPRFWGWVNGSGTLLGAFSDLLISVMNSNAGGFDHAAIHVEQQVIDWQKELMGFPPAASGLLVTGGSVANLIGISVAQNHLAETDTRRHGIDQRAPMRLYCSSETHSSVLRAAGLIGIGTDNVVKISVNDEYRIELDALREAIRADRARGYRPFCIVGNAGTVNTGATDDLEALAAIAEEERLWLHVDGAFGAMTRLSPRLAHITSGISRADSIGFDLHKWLHVPVDAGCVLIRDGDAHRRTFQYVPEYLTRISGGIAALPSMLSDLGFELTRRGRGIKVWMSMREHGVARLGQSIEGNVRQAQYLERRILESPELELLAPVPLNIVCFRYRGSFRDDGVLNALNEEILVALQERGIAAPSSTRLQSRFALRVSITNHRTTFDDIDALVDAVLAIGRERTA